MGNGKLFDIDSWLTEEEAAETTQQPEQQLATGEPLFDPDAWLQEPDLPEQPVTVQQSSVQIPEEKPAPFLKQVGRRLKQSALRSRSAIQKGAARLLEKEAETIRTITQRAPKKLLEIASVDSNVADKVIDSIPLKVKVLLPVLDKASSYLSNQADLNQYGLSLPEYQDLPGMQIADGFFWENNNWKNPQYIALQLADQAPIMGTAILANVAAGPVGSFAIMSALESGFAEQDLKQIQSELAADGVEVSDEDIKNTALAIGTVNGLLELASGAPDIARNIVKKGGNESGKRILKNLIKTGNYKAVGKEFLKLAREIGTTSTKEGVTEALQEYTLEIGKKKIGGESLLQSIAEPLTEPESASALVQSFGVGLALGAGGDVVSAVGAEALSTDQAQAAEEVTEEVTPVQEEVAQPEPEVAEQITEPEPVIEPIEEVEEVTEIDQPVTEIEETEPIQDVPVTETEEIVTEDVAEAEPEVEVSEETAVTTEPSVTIEESTDKVNQAPDIPPEDLELSFEDGNYPMANRGEWYGESNYKAQNGELIELTPDEFLSLAKPLEIDEDARDNIDDLKNHIESGRTLDPLTLYEIDTNNVKASDGRHRAIAAKELGIEKVPVVSYIKEDVGVVPEAPVEQKPTSELTDEQLQKEADELNKKVKDETARLKRVSPESIALTGGGVSVLSEQDAVRHADVFSELARRERIFKGDPKERVKIKKALRKANIDFDNDESFESLKNKYDNIKKQEAPKTIESALAEIKKEFPKYETSVQEDGSISINTIKTGRQVGTISPTGEITAKYKLDDKIKAMRDIVSKNAGEDVFARKKKEVKDAKETRRLREEGKQETTEAERVGDLPSKPEEVKQQEQKEKDAQQEEQKAIATKEDKETGFIEPKEEKLTRATVEKIEEERVKLNLNDITLDEQKKWKPILNKAIKDFDESKAFDLVRSISRAPRVMANEEFTSLVLFQAKIEDKIDSLEQEIVDSKNKSDKDRLRLNLQDAIKDYDALTEAIRYSTREAGRALNIIKLTLEREENRYKLAKLTRTAKITKGENLTAAETAKIEELSAQIEKYRKKEAKLNKEIEALQEKLAKKDAKQEFVKTTRAIKTKRKSSVLKTERDSIFKQLESLGYRLNDVVGATYGTARILSKLAINYFESGITDIEEIADKIQSKVPDISKKDVYDSIGGRIKKTRKTVESDFKKQVRDLKLQAKIMGQIEDAYNGVFDTKTKVPSSEKVRQLRAKLKELKREAEKSKLEDEKLLKIQAKADELLDLINKKQGLPKRERAVESQRIKDAKQDVRELRSLVDAKDKIRDLENQIETGNFKVPVEVKRVIKNEELIKAQVKLAQLRREAREFIYNLKKRTFKEKVIDIITLPRSLMATADFSGVLRQGFFLSTRHPIIAAKAFKASFSSFFDQVTADQIDNAIRNNEKQFERQKAGLFLSSLDKVRFTQREEAFVSNLASKIPVYGKLVEASERQMVSHLNLIRSSVFDNYLELNPDATSEELKEFASFINVATGRGEGKLLKTAGEELSLAFFSPRFSWSRVQLPYEMLRHWKHKNVRKEIARSNLAFIGTVGSVMLLSSLAGAKVGTDPEDSDFLKIIIGNTRIDLLAGTGQALRQEILALVTAYQTAKGVPASEKADILKGIGRFITYKLSPSITIPYELLQGKDVIGRPTQPLKTLRRSVAPLVLEEMIETYLSNPVLGGILAPFILLGVSISTYEKDKNGKGLTKRSKTSRTKRVKRVRRSRS